jgi:hypothetical protein
MRSPAFSVIEAGANGSRRPDRCDEWRVGRGYIAKHSMESLLQERLHPSPQEGILELQPP